MASLEKLSQFALEIISYAGTAKSHYILALNAVKGGDHAACDEKLKIGDENYQQAHCVHKDLLQMEAELMEPQVSLLLMHAEDQLMNAETIKFLVAELISINKKQEGI